MDFIKESKGTPSLVNPQNFKVEIPKGPPVKWNLNVILIIFFILFLAFFLYNCKYGCFKIESGEPTPHNLVYNLNSVNF
jgi:hypothetical protein